MQICSLRSFTTALITLFVTLGLATSAVSQARTPDASGAEPPFARSRDGIRELYIIAFGLFGPESVFGSEAEKAGADPAARLQADAQLLVRFNDKRGGSATLSSLAKGFRGARPATTSRPYGLPWEVKKTAEMSLLGSMACPAPRRAVASEENAASRPAYR